MGRRERVLDPTAGTLAAFAHDLRQLRRAAGSPSYRVLARRAGYSASTLSAAASGHTMPSLAVTLAYAGACGGDIADWEERWNALDEVLGQAELAEAAQAPARPGTPRELPLDVYGFAGRAAELAELDGLTGVDAPGVLAISGTAGVGKTALAVHWAHTVADQFPDGQLYVDLRGYDPDQPLAPGEAVAGFLRALGVDGADVPFDLAERAARYRTAVAGRRMLLLLDNAHSVEQVRPLLPGARSCCVLVTSRDRLPGLVARYGARRLELDLLSTEEAVALLRILVGGRVDTEPDAAAALADRCARLPLALRIAAELAASRPAATLAELVAELADEQHRLDQLDAGDDRTAVRAVFSWSYQRLPEPARRAFRRLGLHPGREFDAYAVAALAGVDLAEAVRLLTALAQAHLVEQSGQDRYASHALLRAYAVRLAAAEDGGGERAAAVTQLLDAFVATAARAMDTLFPHERGLRPDPPDAAAPLPPLDEPDAALAWLDAHRASLVAATAHAAGHGWPTHAGTLAALVWRYLHTGAYYPDALAIHGHALSAAREAGDRAGEGVALHNLGRVYWRWGLRAAALDQYHQALAIYRQVGDHAGEGRTLSNLGAISGQAGRTTEALGHFRDALTIFQRAGDRAGECAALGNLGILHDLMGRYHEATDFHEQALAIHRAIGDRAGEARTQNHLGSLESRLGRCTTALGRHDEAMAMFRALGDRAGEGTSLNHLGDAYGQLGRSADALDYHQRALEIFREIGYRDGEAEACASLGDSYLRAARYDEALAQHRQAVALARDVGDRSVEARALNGQAAGLRGLGREADALEQSRAALALAEHIDDLDQQAGALDGAARALQAVGAIEDARDLWQRALDVYTDLDVPEADDLRARLAALGPPPRAEVGQEQVDHPAAGPAPSARAGEPAAGARRAEPIPSARDAEVLPHVPAPVANHVTSRPESASDSR